MTNCSKCGELIKGKVAIKNKKSFCQFCYARAKNLTMEMFLEWRKK